MSNGKRLNPTTTAMQSRLRLFQPSQRPTLREGDWQETSFGRCRVKGRLGQRHADLTECTFFLTEKKRIVSDGGWLLLIDPAKIRRKLSEGQYSYSQLMKLYGETRSVELELQTRPMMEKDRSLIGGIFDHIEPSTMKRYDPLTKAERELWTVRVNKAFVILLEQDLKFHYDPEPLTRLKHGISQAVARYILTHKHEPNGGWFMDTLIAAVAGNVKTEKMRNNRRELRNDKTGLSILGIEIDKDRIRRVIPAQKQDHLNIESV